VSNQPRRDEDIKQSASMEQRRAPQPQARHDDPVTAAARPPQATSPDGDHPYVREARSQIAEEALLRGGELNAAITSALVGIQTEYLGRGPRRASTFHYGHVLVTLMHEVLTPAEKSLTRTNQTDAVDHIRHLFQETMEADFREAVERLTGRKVLAFISGNHVDPDIAAELFILDAPPQRAAALRATRLRA
jgi:uncharacterized protein YbcI